jgi:hypothetical protein
VLLYTVKEKRAKPDRKPHHMHHGLRNLYTENSSLRSLKIMPTNLKEIVRFIRLLYKNIHPLYRLKVGNKSTGPGTELKLKRILLNLARIDGT